MESIFMQMHNGKRINEGSFNVGLKELFYLADPTNQRKLVKAFPEFFGEEVPEFGITKKNTALKNTKYKGWLIQWKKECFHLFTPDELEQPAGFRDPETECYSIEQAKQFIDNY